MVELDAFHVVGIQARTSFEREKMPGGAIPALWGRVMSEGLIARIPNRSESEIIALYTDYESDEYGAYTLVVGAKVSSIADLPDGMVAKYVPSSRYAVFQSARGPVQKIVIDTWKRIWREPDTPVYERSYRADFEVYGASAADPSDSRIEIYIGMK